MKYVLFVWPCGMAEPWNWTVPSRSVGYLHAEQQTSCRAVVPVWNCVWLVFAVAARNNSTRAIVLLIFVLLLCSRVSFDFLMMLYKFFHYVFTNVSCALFYSNSLLFAIVYTFWNSDISGLPEPVPELSGTRFLRYLLISDTLRVTFLKTRNLNYLAQNFRITRTLTPGYHRVPRERDMQRFDRKLYSEDGGHSRGTRSGAPLAHRERSWLSTELLSGCLVLAWTSLCVGAPTRISKNHVRFFILDKNTNASAFILIALAICFTFFLLGV